MEPRVKFDKSLFEIEPSVKFESNIFSIADNEDTSLMQSNPASVEFATKNEDTASIASNTRSLNKFSSSDFIVTAEKEFKQIPKVYSELEELLLNDGDDPSSVSNIWKYEWKVRSRWIKYEQTVSKVTNKWGEPYVGPLLYQELIYLKNNLQTGTVILNCKKTDFGSVVDEVLDDFTNRGQMLSEHREMLKSIILTQFRSQRAFAGVLTGRKNQRPDNLPATKGNSRLITVNSIAENLSSAAVKETKSPSSSIEPVEKSGTGLTESHVFYIGSESDANKHSENGETLKDRNFQTKIEHLKNHYTCESGTNSCFDVESFLIMTGEVDFLERNVIAFIRLMGDNFVYDLDGFRMKIRFLFIFLGPKSKFSFVEIGRCMGNLMTNKDFKTTAYRAKAGHEVIKGITHYSNQSLCLVLPIGEYHNDLLEPITEWVQKNMKKQCRRKSNTSNKIKTIKPPRLNLKQYAKAKLEAAVSSFDEKDEEDESDGEKEEDEKKYDPFKPTGRMFGTLVKETSNRYRQYWSDIRDGISLQCLIAAVFTFTICLAPTLTFGGILADKTNDWFGVNEMLIAVATNGLFFALFSGQPIMIFGSTGPMLVFEEMLYIFCIKTLHIDFLATRIWVAMWILLITLIIIAFEGIRVIHNVTRFTEEIFSFLIACCFLLDVIKKCVKYFIYDPLYTAEKYCDLMTSALNQSASHQPECPHDEDQLIGDCFMGNTSNNGYYESQQKHLYPEPNIALISVILLLCTFFLSHTLKALRRSSFFGGYLRRTISDMGVLFSIVSMVGVDFMIRLNTKINTQKLDIPQELIPTNLTRTTWLVSPFGNSFKDQVFEWWIPLISFFPAFLIFIILFFEVELIGILLANKNRKLKKGTGFNIDLLLGAIMMTVNSFFGLPWLCAAPVRTLAHWAALATYSQSNIPGEKNKLISVREQRITGIIVHVAIGLCLLAKSALRLIPVPVLFGLLLQFGVVSFSGTQLYDRILYLFMPLKNTPNWSYARGIRVIKRNFFTLLQVVSVGILLVFKSVAVVSFFFPIFLVLLVCLRKFVLPKFYTDRELEQLDDEEEQTDDHDIIHDFYELTHLPL